jgi:hypothetical protein
MSSVTRIFPVRSWVVKSLPESPSSADMSHAFDTDLPAKGVLGRDRDGVYAGFEIRMEAQNSIVAISSAMSVATHRLRSVAPVDEGMEV